MAEAINEANALTETGSAGELEAKTPNAIDVFMESHVVRHFGRLVGLALAVAVGTVVVLWTAEPNYAPLYDSVSGKDASEIANVLTANQIDYKVDTNTGNILVAQGQAAEARLKLAAQGLPQSANRGLEMLQDDQGLGTSQFIEKARYNHALEAELSRSIEAIRSVEKARVHLALPKQSIFIRNRTQPTASVVVKLYSGRRLNQGQVDAIVHMVASSVPMMETAQVTVVDQFGRLLTADQDSDIALTSKQFDYTRKLEESYMSRIIQLLQPIIGEGRVNAQVSAQLDFSQVESTREAYDPERSVIRSEQVSEQEMRDLNTAEGIPGALSNQPPGAGTTDADAAGNEGSNLPASQNRSATRNFEVDRMISHTRNPIGSIQRLSVAVVIDSKLDIKEDGSVEKIPYSDEEIASFEKLVRETIGFDENRGDRVSVINQAFVPAEIELEEVPLWQQLMQTPWVIDLVKQVLGAIGLLIVYLMFIRPFLRTLRPGVEEQRIDPVTGEVIPADGEGGEGAEGEGAGGEGAEGEGDEENALMLDPNNPAALIRRGDATHEQKVEMARSLVMDNPARVANVINNWIADE